MFLCQFSPIFGGISCRSGASWQPPHFAEIRRPHCPIFDRSYSVWKCALTGHSDRAILSGGLVGAGRIGLVQVSRPTPIQPYAWSTVHAGIFVRINTISTARKSEHVRPRRSWSAGSGAGRSGPSITSPFSPVPDDVREHLHRYAAAACFTDAYRLGGFSRDLLLVGLEKGTANEKDRARSCRVGRSASPPSMARTLDFSSPAFPCILSMEAGTGPVTNAKSLQKSVRRPSIRCSGCQTRDGWGKRAW